MEFGHNHVTQPSNFGAKGPKGADAEINCVHDESSRNNGRRTNGDLMNGAIPENTRERSPVDDRDDDDDSDDDDDDEVNTFMGYGGETARRSQTMSYAHEGGRCRPSTDEGATAGQLYTHSYSVSTKSWRRWASRVAATSNLDVVLRNISLLHAACSMLLIFMGVLAIISRGFMSYLALPILSSIFFFLPTCATGLWARRYSYRQSSVRCLMILSILSGIVSIVLGIVYALFVYRDGQFDTDCEPRIAYVISSSCAAPIHRVLINAVDIFLFLIEFVASVFAMGVCCLLRSVAKSPDQEQLITRTSMSYKRLATEDELLSEPTEAPSPSTNNRRYPRSVSAPSVLANRTDEDVIYAD